MLRSLAFPLSTLEVDGRLESLLASLAPTQALAALGFAVDIREEKPQDWKGAF
jgi:hypothetical protein